MLVRSYSEPPPPHLPSLSGWISLLYKLSAGLIFGFSGLEDVFLDLSGVGQRGFTLVQRNVGAHWAERPVNVVFSGCVND